jgi:hypothetical protein
MKQITIQRLSYTNFRGQTRSIDFSPTRTVISGSMGSGKSTVLNALLWLLTGYDEDDKKNYKLFDCTKEFTPENSELVAVEGAFTVTNQDTNEVDAVSVKRTAKSKWEKQRGRTEFVKAPSDEYHFYINDIELTATVFETRIAEIFAQQGKLKLILNVRYWKLIDPSVLRKQFAQLVGEIRPEDFHGDYPKEVLAAVAEVGAEDARKNFDRQVTQTDEQIAKVSASIDARKDLKIDITECDEADAEAEKVKQEITGIDEVLLGMQKDNSVYVEKRRQEEQAIDEKEREYLRASREYEDARKSEIQALNNKLTNAKTQNSGMERRRTQMKQQIENADMIIESLERQRAQKLDELESIGKLAFDGFCPTCGAAFVGQQRQEKLEEFKTMVEKKKALCLMEGKKIRESIDRSKQSKEDILHDIAALERIDTDAIQAEILAWRRADKPFEETEQSAQLRAEIDRMKEARTVVPSTSDAQEVLAKKTALLDKLSQLAKISARREDEKRNEELIAADEKTLQAAYKEKAYREILADKTKEYIREQSAIIRERANRLFPSRTRVEITEFNKSGALVDCLKIFIDDYDATVTNNANKVLAGIDISNAFSAFCGVTMPLIIDNSESINYDEPTDRQRIEMFVVKGQAFRVEGE